MAYTFNADIFEHTGSEDDKKHYFYFFKRFVKLPLQWLLLFEAREVVLLIFLVDWALRKAKPEYDGWFFCPTELIELRIKNMAPLAQWRILKGLKDKGFVSVEARPMLRKTRKGNKRGTQRWIKLHFEVMFEELVKVYQKADDWCDDSEE